MKKQKPDEPNPKVDASKETDDKSQLIKTRNQAADYANVNVRTICRWKKEGMPLSNEGYYIKSILDVFKQSQGRMPDENRHRLLKAEADLKETKAEIANIMLRMKKGELIDSAEIESGHIARIMAVKRALMGLGRKLASRLSKMGNEPAKIQKTIDTDIREIIKQFARE